jgi:hypothetical protein
MQISTALVKNEPLWRRIAIGVGVLVLLLCAARALVQHPEDGDFKVHWGTGTRFVAGQFLYANGADFPYLPILGMLFAPPALLSMPVAKALCYPLGVAALILFLWTLAQLIRPSFQLTKTQSFWAATIAAVLASRFIIRDQAELGFNTIIAMLAWLGVYLWTKKRDVSAGLSLGLAIAIKCTPAIFLGYFIWKRQWRLAICTTAAVLFFTVLPMVWQGPASWTFHMRSWVGNAAHGVAGTGAGFEANEIYRVTNMSFRPALMFYLTHVPQNMFRYWEAPPLRYLNLSPLVAGWIVNSVLLALLGIFLWWSRGPVAARNDPRILWELAVAGILMLLISPISWGQHCVHVLPACYLIAALGIKRGSLPAWITGLIVLYVLLGLLTGRDLLGRWLAVEVMRHHTTTFAILGLFPILLFGPRLQRERVLKR